MPENEPNRIVAVLPVESGGQRLDAVLAQQFPAYSRARLQAWIKAGRVRLDGEPVKRPRHKVLGGERAEIEPEMEPLTDSMPQPVPLDIVYEDETVLVIDKRPGQVVHPGAGNPDGTVLNGLLHYAPELDRIPRAGIVHRLDKETSGLMVVARTVEAQNHLVRQLQRRTVSRVYDAVVQGELIGGGTVETLIGRHPRDRKRMAVLDAGGKPAITHYRVAERFRGFTHLKAQLETGRTHQIRVHMSWLGHPLVGDPVYGRRLRIPKGMGEEFVTQIRAFSRQALHAGQLGFVHPASGKPMKFRAPMPEDMAFLIDVLRDATAVHEAESTADYDEWAYGDEVEVEWVSDDGQMMEWEGE